MPRLACIIHTRKQIHMIISSQVTVIHQRNAIFKEFHWRADSGLLLHPCKVGPSIPPLRAEFCKHNSMAISSCYGIQPIFTKYDIRPLKATLSKPFYSDTHKMKRWLILLLDSMHA